MGLASTQMACDWLLELLDDIPSGGGVYEVIFDDSLLGEPSRTWWSGLKVCHLWGCWVLERLEIGSCYVAVVV